MKTSIVREDNFDDWVLGVKYSFKCVESIRTFTGVLIRNMVHGFVFTGVDNDGVKCHLPLGLIRVGKWVQVNE